MLMWPMGADDTFDDIPNYDDGHVDHLSLDSKNEEITESESQLPQEYQEMPEEKINWQEQVHMIHLRSHLNKLLETLRHAQYIADKTREELKKCRCQIEQYEDEKEKLLKEIQTNEDEGNKVAVPRLQSTLKRVCNELEAEQKLEDVIKDQLEQAEYELALAEVERGKFILAEDNLLQREHLLNSEKAEMAMIRLQKEQLLARNAVTSAKKDKRKIQDALNDAEKRHIHAIEEAEKSHERANKYLSKTLAKLKKRQQEVQDRYNTEMTRKMDMLLKLKKDIANNRENLQVIWTRDKAAERQKKLAEKEEMNKILAEGGNAEVLLLMKKRKNDVEKKKQQFEAEQKVKRVSIVQKILKEEESFKKRMELQPYLWTDPAKEKAMRLGPMKRKPPKALLDYIAACADERVEVEKVDHEDQKEIEQVDVASSDSYFTSEEYRKTLRRLSFEMKQQIQIKKIVSSISSNNKDSQNESKNKTNNEDGETENELLEERADLNMEDDVDFLEEELNQMVAEEEEEEEEGEDEDENEYSNATEEPSIDKDFDISEAEEDEEIQVDLAKPEFEGLWSKDTIAYKAYKDTDSLPAKPIGRSKMEQEILKKTLEKTRAGIIITQVAAGKEFSGCSFYSKPKIIHFKDFVVGKSYKKKVMLTNVSYTVNYIRFMDITDNLKDFIKISFEPPGQMSAGMTCEMTVTFKPLINEDLKGEVYFLTQTGPFQVPLMCSTKKCDLILNTKIIDFGTSVIGETLKQSFVLTNRGSLGTKFSFYKVTEIKPKAPLTKAYLNEQFSEFLESNESQESTIENIQSVVQFSQPQDEDHEFHPDDIIYVNEVASEIPTVLKSKTIPTFSVEDTEIKKTSSTRLANQLIEDPSNMLEQISDKRKSLEGNLERMPSLTVTNLDVAEEVNHAREGTEYRNSEEMDRSSDKDIVVSHFKTQSTPSPSLVPYEEDDITSLDGLKVGPLFSGSIGPFSSVRLEIIWQPTIPGEVNSEFIVSFEDPQIESLSVHAVANAIDVPVWMERQTVDLKICMFDRLYQDTVVINNRATIAQKLQFEVCKELQNHLELLPKTGYIQAHSQFSAQLKFLPRQSLFKEAAKFFDTETGVLEAPMTVRVGGQITPVCFTVQAVVTTSDLEFNISDIDFGCCTVHESVKQTLKLTNKSILPQQYGFVGLPECLEVQPNDGFGTLLPLETLELDVIFSPKAAKYYKMNLLVKNLINRDFSIPCKGVGVLTPLELSQQVIHFCATPLYDTSSEALFVMNNHTSTNEFSHPVPRIGSGEICPVGPTSFEFKVPEGASITISPSVGTVLPGQKMRVEVRFAPTLSRDDIKLEVMKICLRLEEEREEKEREEAARREKQELESEPVIEPKPKKGAKQADININNLEGANNMYQDLQVNVNNHYEFDDFEIFENGALEVPVLNKSENKSQQNYIIETSDNIYDKMCDISNHNQKINNNDTSMISLKACSNKHCKSSEKSTPNRTQAKYTTLFQNINYSSLRNVISQYNCNVERTDDNLSKNVSRIITSKQDDINIKMLSRNMPEGITIKKGIHSNQHNVVKLQGRSNEDKYKKVGIKINKMNTGTSTSPNEDKNNNMVENNDEDLENKQLSPGKRSNEGLAEFKPASKLIISGASNVAFSSQNYNGDDNANDWLASVGKRKSTLSPKMSIAKSKSKVVSVQSLASSAQDLASIFDPDKISSDSQIYRAAVATLIRQFKGDFQSVIVPCYVASGKADIPGELNYSIHNTLYLEVHCPAIKPPVIVISNDGRRTVDFGSVSVGQTCSKWVTVMNICEKEIKLKATALNPEGPFQIQNALRTVVPGGTHNLLLTFTPNQDFIFQENLGIKAFNTTLHLILKGCGVKPLVNLSIEDGLLDMKAVLVGEFVEQTFMIENLSPLAINYTIKQDSLSHLRHDKAQLLPPFLGAHGSHKTKNYVGPQNKSGKSVFDIVPSTGTINPGEASEIMVTFAPDHESDLFSDGIRIELFYQNCSAKDQESHFFQVVGQGKSQIMFLEGCDPLELPIKSLTCISKQGQDDESSGLSSTSQPALITMHSVMKGNFFEASERNIFIGCIRTNAPNQKKSGDFIIDGLQGLLQKGFTVQPQKGSVEADSKTVVLITWFPPPNYDPSSVVEETVNLTLKGDVTEQFPIVIRAMIVSQ